MADADKEIDEDCENNNSLDGFTVRQLKRYLANRKLNVSGRKLELIERVKGAYRLKLKNNSALDCEESKVTDCERFQVPTGEVVPRPETLREWSFDFSSIPSISYKEIYNYIVLKKQSKRQLKSRGYFEDKHVFDVKVHPVNDECSHCYVRASVLPSLPTADAKKSPAYETWALMSKITGCIHSAYCSCPAGQGECCNHIGGLLYAVADIAEKEKAGELASTSKPCVWNKPRKRKLTPRKSEDVVFRKQRMGTHPTRQLSVLKDHKLNEINGCTVNVDRFKNKLEEKNVNVGWLKNFNEPKKTEVIPKLNNILYMYSDSTDLRSEECQKMFISHIEQLSVSEEDVAVTEIETRNQGSLEWREARRERLTSSYFGAICKRKESTKPDCLLKEMLYSEFRNKYTEYGRRHEKAARKTYIKHMKAEHVGISVKDSGLIISTEHPFLGTSPDGLVHCSHCEKKSGVLEIKCPASLKWRMLTPEECCSDKNFFCFVEDGKVKLKRDHKYYYQVQGQMGVSGRRWCDFVVWTCVGISVERIQFDSTMWKNMCVTLGQFYVKFFLPELFSRRIERGIPLF